MSERELIHDYVDDDLDEFLDFIKNKVNLKRVEVGLNEITQEDALICYGILIQFNKRWST